MMQNTNLDTEGRQAIMERRRFFGRLMKALGGLCAGLLLFGSNQADGAGTAAQNRRQLPDGASFIGRCPQCGNECSAQPLSMCPRRGVGVVCGTMGGRDCRRMRCERSELVDRARDGVQGASELPGSQ